MATGKVKFYDATKGFGFFETPDSGDDVFFHVDDIDGPDPREGEEFSFEIEQGPKGPRATAISR